MYNFNYVPTITLEKDGKKAFRVDIFETTKCNDVEWGVAIWKFLKIKLFKTEKPSQWIGVASVVLNNNNELLYYKLCSDYELTLESGGSMYCEEQFKRPGESFPKGLYDEQEEIVEACKKLAEIWG